MIHSWLRKINIWANYGRVMFLGYLLFVLTALIAALGIVGFFAQIADASFYVCVVILGVVTMIDTIAIFVVAAARLKLGNPQ